MKYLLTILILVIAVQISNSLKKRLSAPDDDDKMGPLSKYNFHTLFATEKTLIGPRCIPLTSRNIEANPYHYSLVSRKGAEVRRGIGKPIILEHPPLLCPADSPSECIFNVEKSLSVTITSSVSINIGKSNSLASSVGSSLTRGQSNLFSHAIGKSIERSLTNSITDSDEESVSKQLSEDFAKSHEKSTGITLGKSKENSQTATVSEESAKTKTKSQEQTNGKTDTNEETHTNTNGGSRSETNSKSHEINAHMSVSVKAEFKIPFIGGSEVTGTVGGGYSHSWSNSATNENNWQNSRSTSKSQANTNSNTLGETDSQSISNGKSNSNTEAYSSSSSEENRAMDSISYSVSLANSLVKGKSKQNATSKASSTGYNINDNYQATNETSLTNNINEEKSFVQTSNTDRSWLNSTTLSVSSSQAYHIKKGECKILVCMPFVISAAVPYKCLLDNNELYEMFTEIMLVDNSTRIECVQSLIDCMAKNEINTFMHTNMEFVHTTNPDYWHSRLDYGRNAESLETKEDLIILKSANSYYQLVLNTDGNLKIKNFEKIIWQNEMNNYLFNKSRVRINEKGHLIQEAQNIFSVDDYRRDEWISVWSSAPINHNVTIGIPNMNGKSYVLVLNDFGFLNLYDAVGAIIWCSDIGCQHRLGYKFPEIYLVPTKFLTAEEENNHNSISKSIVKTNLTSFRSMDAGFNSCTRLKSNEALISTSGRFKLILEESGNLILKDDVRTMWESVSGYIPHTVSPYYLHLTPMCQLRITSKNGYAIWYSGYRSTSNDLLGGVRGSGCFIDLNELDKGRLVVKDKNNSEIWQSWPTQANNLGITLKRPFQHRYVPCDGEPYKYRHKLHIDTHMNSTESLTSPDGLWDLVIYKSKIVIRHLNIIKSTLVKSYQNIARIIFKSNGILQVYYSDAQRYDSYKFLNNVDSNSSLTISIYGDLSIKDSSENTLWTFNNKDLTKII